MPLAMARRALKLGPPRRVAIVSINFDSRFFCLYKLNTRIQPSSPVPAAPGPTSLLVARATPPKAPMLRVCYCFLYFHVFSTLIVPCLTGTGPNSPGPNTSGPESSSFASPGADVTGYGMKLYAQRTVANTA